MSNSKLSDKKKSKSKSKSKKDSVKDLKKEEKRLKQREKQRQKEIYSNPKTTISNPIKKDKEKHPLNDVNKYSLKQIQKEAKIESDKCKKLLLNKFKKVYTKFLKRDNKKISKDLDFEKLLKKCLDNFKENPILVIHIAQTVMLELIKNKPKYYIEAFELYQQKNKKNIIVEFVREIQKIEKDKKIKDKKEYIDLIQRVYSNQISDKFYYYNNLKAIAKTKQMKKKYTKLMNIEKEKFNYLNRLLVDYYTFNYPISTPPQNRIKFGCVNFNKSISGCAQFYGEFWLRLYNNKDIKERITISPVDSFYLGDVANLKEKHNINSSIGTLEHCNHVLFLMKNKDFDSFVYTFYQDNEYNIKDYRQPYDNKFNYIEQQIHGKISLKDDVAELFYPVWEVEKKSNVFVKITHNTPGTNKMKLSENKSLKKIATDFAKIYKINTIHPYVNLERIDDEYDSDDD